MQQIIDNNRHIHLHSPLLFQPHGKDIFLPRHLHCPAWPSTAPTILIAIQPMANSVKHNAIAALYKNRARRRNLVTIFELFFLPLPALCCPINRRIEDRLLECIFRFSILALPVQYLPDLT